MLPLVFVSITEAQTSNKPIIVCTTSAVGSIVEECLGSAADVLVLVQPGLCPADFDIRPGYVEAVSKATILFKQDIPGEFWLNGLLESAGNSDLTIVAIPGEYNTPEGAKNYVRGVTGNLSQILNINLDSKILEILDALEDVSTWIASQANTLDASNVKVICMSWLKSFIESTGFNVVATYNPPETLSAGDIIVLLETAQSEDVALVVDNLQIDVEFGAGIASQVGAEHLVLTNFPGAIPGTENLPKMLRYNAERLFNGTITWQFTSTLKTEKAELQNQIGIFQIIISLTVVVALVEGVLLYTKRKRK